MNPHFFTTPFYYAFIWFRVQGSGFRVQGSGFRALVAASPPFLEDGILISQPSPLGNADDTRRTLSAVLRAFLPAANSLKRDTPKEADGWQRSENE